MAGCVGISGVGVYCIVVGGEGSGEKVGFENGDGFS